MNQWKDNWTDEIFRKAEKLNSEGFSAAEIARQINEQFRTTFSRNSVIGKLNRNGVKKSKQPLKPRVGSSHKSVRVIKHNVAVLASTEVPELPPTKLNPETNVELMGLEKGMCKWPVDDRLYCGAAVFATRHSSYCKVHAARSADPLRARRYEEGRVKRIGRYY